MAENSKIEWTDHTFNPWIGCRAISPGCKHCYAEAYAKRVGRDFATRTRTSEANWRLPLKWNSQPWPMEGVGHRRPRVFCASLADVFDNEVDPLWRADLFALIDKTPNLDWLLLTKRIGNVNAMLTQILRPETMPANVWLGATVVNQEEADRDIPKLLATPARVRFLSIEPMLGPVSLDCWPVYGEDEKPLLHWVICGGESGHGARPMHPQWVRDIRDQCAAAGVPFLFKQWGEWGPPKGDGTVPKRGLSWSDNLGGWTGPMGAKPEIVFWHGKKAAGRLLDGVQHDGFPL